jgi:hypothetical protein
MDALTAHEAIRGALARYCRGLDRGDAALLRTVFTPTARIDQGAYAVEGEAFAARVAAGHGDRRSQHRLAQSVIELDGDGAWSETYFHALSRSRDAAGAEHELSIHGRYVDRWTLAGNEARIVERRVIWDFTRSDIVTRRWPGGDGSEPRLTATGAPFDLAALTWGRPSTGDASYEP